MFLGCDRNKLTSSEFRAKYEPYMQVNSSERARYEEFWRLSHYLAGNYSSHDDFKLLNDEINKLTKGTNANRLFYLSIPPTAFASITELIKANCMAKNGWNRVIIEKPFGKDTESSKKLSDHLAKLFVEEQIYRMDHYLGQEMVQNLLTFRFSNKIFSPTWNRDNIAAVMITFKEPFGV
ncbi:glucose-6-phosphate 1-dehydrogenase-like, partial [Contarinia nasturtii]|uniref:glucose-6-phosphate 1-dehydrogenase-like n=1 Tax=Contarinia nasturtii TaxID=265458 RepID=UPI0012D46A2A